MKTRNLYWFIQNAQTGMVVVLVVRFVLSQRWDYIDDQPVECYQFIISINVSVHDKEIWILIWLTHIRDQLKCNTHITSLFSYSLHREYLQARCASMEEVVSH